MLRVGLRVWAVALCAALSFAVGHRQAKAVSLDSEGTMKLGVRAYVNARIGTERTDETVFFQRMGNTTSNTKSLDSRTFPTSGAGHLRQNRFFMEAEFDHDLTSLRKRGFGPLYLLDSLPFRIRGLKYHLVFRGEYDGIYDWGPREYRTSDQFQAICRTPGGGRGRCPIGYPSGDQVDGLTPNPATGGRLDIPAARKRLRDIATNRERLFQAYIEGSVGDVFVRFGRQILSWGETDGFRLLDNINPVDSSFGGFLIALDERRIPLDMLRLQYDIGSIGPISEAFLEFYGAIDNKVAYAPGTPSGSPWTLPNLGEPSRTTKSFTERPRRNFTDMRGGGRAVWNMFNGTFSLAHYWTYFDTPGLQVYVKPNFPVSVSNPGSADFDFDGDGPERFSAVAIQSAPLVQVTGASGTFDVPQLYTIFRSEFAYFNGEPRFRQSELDPFMFHFYPSQNQKDLISNPRNPSVVTGGRRTGDSVNLALGADINAYIRFLNPQQTFFISTQFFYKHLLGAAQRRKFADNRLPEDGEVLPVPEFNTFVEGQGISGFGAVEPNFVRNPTDQFLQTLFITTAYASGQVSPYFGMFYDWSGAFVFQPGVTFTRDPFRFTVDYSILDATRLKGGSGVSLLRDRDNVQFRIEYVI